MARTVRGGACLRALLATLAAPPPSLALLETGDGTYVSDLEVAGAASATLALLAVASLASGTNGGRMKEKKIALPSLSGLSSELRHRLNHVEALEVRLDVTTLWCFVLARDLCTPPRAGGSSASASTRRTWSVSSASSRPARS